jgi:hypothetical protein
MRQYTKVTRVLLPAITAVLLTVCGGQWSHADPVAELIALANKIQNETPGIVFELWTEGDKTTFQVSEPVVFGFKADKDCYLAMINVGTSGQTTLLFPNKWHPDNKITKEKTYRIPPEGSDYAFKLMGPPGNERIKVIASLEPILANVQSLQQELRTPVEQSGSGGGTFLTMKNPSLVLKDIGFAFAGVDPGKWATLEMAFPVVAAGSAPPPGTPVGASPAPDQKPQGR